MNNLTDSTANIAALRGKLDGRSIDSVPDDETQGEAPSIRGPPAVDRLVGLKELRGLIGNPGVSTIYDWMAQGKFPKPLRIGGGGGGRVAWKMSAIQSWMDSLQPADVKAA